uniref:Uncharacterized protein n=1 Tax=Anguilla anguilla TaxID=7936 RepID=A0A0E9Q0V7_ANGAN
MTRTSPSGMYSMLLTDASKGRLFTTSILDLSQSRTVLSSAAERICLSLLHHRAFLMAEVWPVISWGSASGLLRS